MVLSTYMTSCGCSSEPMTGQAWLKGGTFAHGAAGPPTVRFRPIRLLGAKLTAAGRSAPVASRRRANEYS
jgi:hypothetical protein